MRTETITTSATFIPTSYDGSSTFPSGNVQNSANGLNGSNNTSAQARFTVTSTTYYAIYNFSVSGIPSNATINSVSCTARAYVNNTTRVTTRTMQLYTGNTAKGSATTISRTTSAVYTLSVGNWTLSELANARIRITGQKSTSTQTGYIYFYGATLTVNYTYQETVYEISATSEYAEATITPSEQDVKSGETATVRLDVPSIDSIVVTDNGTDVTDLFETKIKVTSGTTIKYAESFTTGLSVSNAAFYLSANQTGTQRLEYPIGYTAESPHSQSDTGHTYVKDGGNNTATGWINYKFDFSEIPEGATIKSVTIKCYGSRENATVDSTHKAMFEAYCGNTQKGSSQEFTSTSLSAITLSNIGTWTREELQDAQLRFTVAYYGGRVYGITWTVEWEDEHGGENPYYYEYTITGVNSDHEIIVSENIIVPPEEDPEKTYYSTTISSINAKTTPGRGTTRLESGSTEVIEIVPSDPQLTLALDNGVDISSQLVEHAGPAPTSAVTTPTGASYGFQYSSSTGYYVSQNKGVSMSAAVCKIDFELPVRCLITIQYINYAEATYDFGVFGNIDVPLSNDYYAAGSGGATITDTDYKLACNTSSYNTSSVQTITYEIPAGSHSIYIKYSKDDATDNNNDTLQFRVSNIEQLEINSTYTYTLNNINSDHSLVFIFGNVSYYFVNSSVNGEARIYPDGQMVVLPEESYRLVVVPTNVNDIVTVTDNNIDVTEQLERKEETVEKEGQTITVVNYIYSLSDVQTGHTIAVVVVSESTTPLFIKISGTWTNVKKMYKKTDGRWVEDTNYSETFSNGNVFVFKNS